MSPGIRRAMPLKLHHNSAMSILLEPTDSIDQGSVGRPLVYSFPAVQ